MDEDEAAKISHQRKRGVRGAFAAGGTLGAAVMAAVASGLFADANAYSDPLKEAVKDDKVWNIQPDQLAADIAKDPTLQARWKALREYVSQIDEQVGTNLKRAGGGSQDASKHWKNRLSEENGPDVHPVR